MSNQRHKRRRSALKSIKRKDTVGILLLGDENVGKTSLLKRWLAREGDEVFSGVHTPTVEDFYCMQFTDCVRQITVGIVDIAGSGQFPAMDELYISKADSIIFFYEIGNERSIKSVERYFQNVQKIIDDRTVVFTVVGTKLDKYDDGGYYEAEDIGKEYFKQLKNPPLQVLTSAKAGVNVDKAFEYATGEVFKKLFPDMSRIKTVSCYRSNENISDIVSKQKKICCDIL